jgi:hypothetical protein
MYQLLNRKSFYIVDIEITTSIVSDLVPERAMKSSILLANKVQ